MPTVFAVIMTPEITKMLMDIGMITEEQRAVLMQSGLRLAEKRVVSEVAEGITRALHENFNPQEQTHAWLLIETLVDIFIKFGLMKDADRTVLFEHFQQAVDKAAKAAGFNNDASLYTK